MRKTKIVRNIFISLGVLIAPRLLAAASFITFDAPGAVFGTVPFDINSEGAITGYFNDVNFMSHGFLRAQNGAITTFRCPRRRQRHIPHGDQLGGNDHGYLL